MKKIFSIISIICLIALSACSKNGSDNSDTYLSMLFPELHNGDAIYYKNCILTSVNGELTMIDDMGQIRNYSGIYSQWIDAISEENIIVYANANHQVGISILNQNNEIISNDIILKTENLTIDPSIIKYNDMYYLSLTEIEGTVNNADINQENGVYTVHLYCSDNLKDWEFVTDIIKEKHNLEDVELFVKDNMLGLLYEKETIDKGDSQICVKIAMNDLATTWDEEIELLPADADHEPSKIIVDQDEIRLYYSCDKDKPHESYMGASVYYAVYDNNWNLKSKDQKIDIDTEKGILLYDVKSEENYTEYLMAYDYLTECDLATVRAWK